MITQKELTDKLTELEGLIDWIKSIQVSRIPNDQKAKALRLIGNAHSSLDDVLYIYQDCETIESKAKALRNAIKHSNKPIEIADAESRFMN